MYDHDIPRAQIDRLDKLAELLGEIRDRLPERVTPVPDGQVALREPAVGAARSEPAAGGEAGSARVVEPAATVRATVGKPPPRSGPRSGRDAWVAYARHNGLAPDGMTRDEIIDALRQTNIPVD